jgi:hypothetical protein
VARAEATVARATGAEPCPMRGAALSSIAACPCGTIAVTTAKSVRTKRFAPASQRHGRLQRHKQLQRPNWKHD